MASLGFAIAGFQAGIDAGIHVAGREGLQGLQHLAALQPELEEYELRILARETGSR
jgi:hypothetical protein